MTKKIRIALQKGFGRPEDVVEIEDTFLPALAPHQVLVEMKMATINPADLNLLQGKYGLHPLFPSPIGYDGAGIIIAMGSEVDGMQIGQLVISPSRLGSWCGAYIAEPKELIILPPQISFDHAALLSVNPPTAWKMLHDFIQLYPGDWIIQNASNSAVGRCVIDIARYHGWKTINIVRNPDHIPILENHGGDIVLIESNFISQKIQNLLNDAPIRLGLNAVGGDSGLAISQSLSPHGTLITYGALSKKPLTIDNNLLIYNDISFKGFWRTDWINQATRDDIERVFVEISSLATLGMFKAPIEYRYRFDDLHQALKHAQSPRKGKIQLIMND